MYQLKKSLGQHFLKDEKVCQDIVDSLSRLPLERLVEVGPGGGALTKYLLELPNTDLIAVELDEEKVQYLEKTYPAIRGKILHESILEVKPPFDLPFTLVGNFPYNISSQILFRLIEWRELITGSVGMFQKEVAQRVAAKEGSKVYGVVSVLVQAYYHVEYLFEVDENCFQPPPKVKSAVIRLTPRIPPKMKSEKLFFTLVKSAFNQRRKTLRNAVKGLFLPAELQDPLFDKRAEQLSMEQFAELTFRMQ
jgi:16S rRNA (adenine1518-N6/adenine1519-N6)-dimethyltransferase